MAGGRSNFFCRMEEGTLGFQVYSPFFARSFFVPLVERILLGAKFDAYACSLEATRMNEGYRNVDRKGRHAEFEDRYWTGLVYRKRSVFWMLQLLRRGTVSTETPRQVLSGDDRTNRHNYDYCPLRKWWERWSGLLGLGDVKLLGTMNWL